MILESNEAELRLNNPSNLINQLRLRMNSGAVSDRSSITPFHGLQTLPAKADDRIISLPPSIDDLVDDVEDQIATAAKDKQIKNISVSAVAVLDRALINLKSRIDEVERPKDLAKIATDMSKIIHDDGDNNKVNNFNQVIVWKPMVANENHYETIRVHE